MIQDGIKDLFASERGVFCILLLVAATLLAFFGKVTADQWIDFVKWLVTVLVASKTITGVAQIIKPSASSPTTTKE